MKRLIFCLVVVLALSGCISTNVEKDGSAVVKNEKVEDTTYEYEKVIVRLETYMSTILNGAPTALEHTDTKWIPRNQLLSLDFAPADIPAVEKLIREQ